MYVQEESKTEIKEAVLWFYKHKDTVTKYPAPCKVFIWLW